MQGCVLRPLCAGEPWERPRSKEATDKHFRSSKPVWWAWLDLNQRPHPYQAYSRDAFKLVEGGRPAHGRRDSDRGCPLDTEIHR
jgi:hypothetical protein